MKTSIQGKVALAASEGIVPAVYLDSVGVPTYGIGVTHWAIGKAAMDALPDKMPTDLNAEIRNVFSLFDQVLGQYESGVRDAVKVDLEQHEFDALVHFTYNVGVPNFRRSRLLRLLNAGDKRTAGRTGFHGWLRPPELRGRRDKESDMFLNADYGSGAVPIYRTNGSRKLAGRLKTMSRDEVVALLSMTPAPIPEGPADDKAELEMLRRFFHDIKGRVAEYEKG